MLPGNIAHSKSQNLDSNSSEPISIMATLGTVHLSPATEESMTILKTHPLFSSLSRELSVQKKRHLLLWVKRGGKISSVNKEHLFKRWSAQGQMKFSPP